MNLLLAPCVFLLLPLAFTLREDSLLGSVPRKFVPFNAVHARVFNEVGVTNYSTMLIREDLDLLVVGAKEAVFSLDLHNITRKQSSLKWAVRPSQNKLCVFKGKHSESECRNYIKILHWMKNGKMLVCGTNAFNPKCYNMHYSNRNLTQGSKMESGKQKCPFDPAQRHASLMDGNNLYSATYENFKGNKPTLTRSSPVYIRSEESDIVFNEPTFVYMAQMPEDETNGENDDKVYLFFNENAVERDFYQKVAVPRVARVCKGDLGGLRILHEKWTTFLKATLDCPVPESSLPYIIQDAYLWCDPKLHWMNCLFYVIFTSQIDKSDPAAVCVYPVSNIITIFETGTYRTSVHSDISFINSHNIPFPRPGACINNEARRIGINRTADLPDNTLLFVKNRPLMDNIISPRGDKPLLMRKGATFTRIFVNHVNVNDGQAYNVMFMGTEDGTLLKIVDFGGETFIIEEIELFQQRKPIKILTFSNFTHQLYVGSDSGVAQIPLASCEKASSCLDCVLSRDPYCGWDRALGKCVASLNSQRNLLQSLKEGNASSCTISEPINPIKYSIWEGENLTLSCPLPSNLAKTSWRWNNSSLIIIGRLHQLEDRLLIFNASQRDEGLYQCLSVEHTKTDMYTTTVAEYEVTVNKTIPNQTEGKQNLKEMHELDRNTVLYILLTLLTISLFMLLIWNFYKGYLACTFCKIIWL